MRIVVLVPEALVALAALDCLLTLVLRRPRRWLALEVLVLVLAALALEAWQGAAVGTLFRGGLAQDRFALFAKLALLISTAVLVAVAGGERGQEVTGAPRLGLVLLICLAGMLEASSTQLVGLWAPLALGAGSAAAAADLRAGNREEQSPLVVGRIVATGFLLGMVGTGFVLLQSVARSSQLATVQVALGKDPLSLALVLAVLLTGLGLVGLIALALAPTGLDERFSSGAGLGPGAAGGLGVGVAAIVLFKTVAAASGATPGWAMTVAVVAAGGILSGGLGSLAARTPRLQVGYLVLAQFSWVLAATVVEFRQGVGAGLFLFGLWLLAATILPVVGAMEEVTGWRHLAALEAGKTQARLRAVVLLVGVLSLAGMPPLGGWLGQMGILVELARGGWWWLVALGLVGWLLAGAGCLRMVRGLILESLPGLERERGRQRGQRDGTGLSGSVLTWVGVAGVGGFLLVVVLYPVFANPIWSLAVQGAEALGL